jgi:hypothetical protein
MATACSGWKRNIEPTPLSVVAPSPPPPPPPPLPPSPGPYLFNDTGYSAPAAHVQHRFPPIGKIY